jgi:hypothetical protein
VDGLLAEAESAFAAQQFDAALAFYEEALKLDPRDGRARLGRELCMKAMAAAAPAAAPRFVSGATAYTPARAAATGPAGFESSGAVSVRRVDQPAAAAGKIVFEVEPDKVTAGEPFVLKVFMVNDAAAPLELAGGVVTTVVDGRTAGGPVALAATSLRPRSRALVFSVTDRWRAELQSWSFSIALRTASGDAYSNSLSWKR